MSVRLIVNVNLESAAAVDQALGKRIETCRVRAQEEGCLQYEIFRSAVNPEKIVLLEHWASREMYDKHWTSQVAREGLPPARPGGGAAVEIYPYQRFQIVDGIWVPVDGAMRSTTIRWP
jgi:quinol monooxygenase YgiN